jgi:hypothetical protein
MPAYRNNLYLFYLYTDPYKLLYRTGKIISLQRAEYLLKIVGIMHTISTFASLI